MTHERFTKQACNGIQCDTGVEECKMDVQAAGLVEPSEVKGLEFLWCKSVSESSRVHARNLREDQSSSEDTTGEASSPFPFYSSHATSLLVSATPPRVFPLQFVANKSLIQTHLELCTLIH